IYSVNHGSFFEYSKGVQNYIDACQRKTSANGGPYTQRYTGSMVSDLHRNLIKGGVFMYPGLKGHPSGKLRLMYECNPFAFIMEVAGGKSTNGKQRTLDIQPTKIHERSPLFIGSKNMMEELETYLAE
ncbi:MAG: fructose-1,6-bisphosphatase, partial [Chitinophagaceae bacterium]